MPELVLHNPVAHIFFWHSLHPCNEILDHCHHGICLTKDQLPAAPVPCIQITKQEERNTIIIREQNQTHRSKDGAFKWRLGTLTTSSSEPIDFLEEFYIWRLVQVQVPVQFAAEDMGHLSDHLGRAHNCLVASCRAQLANIPGLAWS